METGYASTVIAEERIFKLEDTVKKLRALIEEQEGIIGEQGERIAALEKRMEVSGG